MLERPILIFALFARSGKQNGRGGIDFEHVYTHATIAGRPTGSTWGDLPLTLYVSVAAPLGKHRLTVSSRLASSVDAANAVQHYDFEINDPASLTVFVNLQGEFPIAVTTGWATLNSFEILVDMVPVGHAFLMSETP